MIEKADAISYKVLVVDDQLFIRVSITKLLQEMGWEKAGEACNGREAIDLYRQLRPDLVVMDVTMPLISGIDALKVIKSSDPAARIILLTSIGQEDEIARAMELGAIDYVLKPFKKEDLIEVFERAMARPRLLIAEDNLERRFALKRLIEESNFDLVGEAAHGQEAIELYQRLKPDVLFMGVHLPILDGISAYKELSTLDPYARVVLTAEASHATAINKAYEAGATQVLIKPFNRSKFVEAIERAMQAKVRIMVVDDQVFLRRLLSKLITENGWILAGEAANGKEAIERYEEFRPDIVMMDVTMPILNGREALKRIRLRDPQACVVMVSGDSEQAHIESALHDGAKAYVMKPFQDEQVIGVIRRLASLLTWKKLRKP